MKDALRSVLLLLATLSAAADAAAQQDPPSGDATAVQEVVLSDGSRLYGAIVSIDDGEVVLRTAAGAVVRAPRAQVVCIRDVRGRIVRGEFQREDPNGTRLFFGPTGRSLERGEVYLGVYEFMLPFVQAGVTDRFSIGGGTPLVFGFADESGRPFWVTPKLQLVSRPGLHAAAGAFHGFSPDGDIFGIAYGVVTREVRGGSVTAGAGLAYASDGGRGGVAMIGVDAALRRNMKFVSENYIWRSAAVASGGVRFFGDSLSADVGLGFVFTEGEVFAGPIVNFMYLF